MSDAQQGVPNAAPRDPPISDALEIRQLVSLVPQALTLVIRGNFNPYVFSPEWLSHNDFAQSADVIRLTLGGVQDGIRFTVDPIEWVVDQTTIRLSSKGFSPEIASIGKRILTLLPHTPIRSVGYVFSYKSQEQSTEAVPLIQGVPITSVFSTLSHKLETDLIRWGMVSRFGPTRIDSTFISGSSGVTANFVFHTNVGEQSPVDSAADAITYCEKLTEFSNISKELLAKALPTSC